MTIQRADSKILMLYNCLNPSPYGQDPMLWRDPRWVESCLSGRTKPHPECSWYLTLVVELSPMRPGRPRTTGSRPPHIISITTLCVIVGLRCRITRLWEWVKATSYHMKTILRIQGELNFGKISAHFQYSGQRQGILDIKIHEVAARISTGEPYRFVILQYFAFLEHLGGSNKKPRHRAISELLMRCPRLHTHTVCPRWQVVHPKAFYIFLKASRVKSSHRRREMWTISTSSTRIWFERSRC